MQDFIIIELLFLWWKVMFNLDCSDLSCSIGKFFFFRLRLGHLDDNWVQFFLRIDTIINPHFRCLDWYETIKHNFSTLDPVSNEESLVKNEKRAK